MPAHVELTEKVGQIDEIKFFFIGELGIAPGSFHLSYFLFFCITMYTILFMQAGSKKERAHLTAHPFLPKKPNFNLIMKP